MQTLEIIPFLLFWLLNRMDVILNLCMRMCVNTKKQCIFGGIISIAQNIPDNTWTNKSKYERCFQLKITLRYVLLLSQSEQYYVIRFKSVTKNCSPRGNHTKPQLLFVGRLLYTLSEYERRSFPHVTRFHRLWSNNPTTV